MSKKPSNSTLDYCPNSGEFSWVSRIDGSRKPAGSINKKLGYIQVGVNGKVHYAHRLAWMMHYGYSPSFIDHINGNRADNRICNLREVTKKENHRNMACFSNSATKVTGVCWIAQLKKWRAYITVNGKNLHLGCFPEFNEAVAARKSAEISYQFHPNHGR